MQVMARKTNQRSLMTGALMKKMGQMKNQEMTDLKYKSNDNMAFKDMNESLALKARKAK